MDGVTPKGAKESPKTPGGISKSLLTPCRRVGLSRKWRKSGSSPFISPLGAQNTTPESVAVKEEKERKKNYENMHMEVNIQTTKELDILGDSRECSLILSNNSVNNNDITSTPCRNSQVSRKKSKVLSISLKSSQETENHLQSNKSITASESKNEIDLVQDQPLCNKSIEKLSDSKRNLEVEPIQQDEKKTITKLTRTGSKSKKLSLKKSLSKTECKSTFKEQPKDSLETEPREKSPNNLTKECIAVIQNKIFKTDSHATNKTEKPLHDSDSEPEIPLSALKRNGIDFVALNTLDDNDFISKPLKKKSRNLSMKKPISTNATESNNTSQSSQEEMVKRTILVKKTYDKVVKPQKAKSTGSITQQDIEDLKAQIEIKKKLLLAKSMEDTEELRDLIKKWQKGCQNALMELLDLMKKKLPDRQNMNYAEILGTLKIPAELVGYDSDNDCFITPDDSNILFSAFKV